ncbi:hypothetical protein [[Mycobacterium] fortunisiensis]|nr:hypothetical protein [[Mycobacterium] fortunisiensis]
MAVTQFPKPNITRYRHHLVDFVAMTQGEGAIMDFKKFAVTTSMAGALGLGAFGLGAGLAHAVPDVPPPPPVPGPAVPGVNVPDVNVPSVNVPDVNVPTVRFPEVDNFFRQPNGNIAPGQLVNSPTINGVANPFFGIPPGQLETQPTVNGVANPFYNQTPGHWVIPEGQFPPAS